MPPDDFYPGYSLFQDFGYGPEGEVNLTRKSLSDVGVKPTDETVRDMLELTRDLVRLIQGECRDEIEVRRQFIQKEIIVGGFVPPDVEIAKSIILLILELLKQWGWVIPPGYKLLKTILDRLRQKKNPSNLDTLAISALEKIGTDDVEKIVAEKAETITIKVKRVRKAKPGKQTSH